MPFSTPRRLLPQAVPAPSMTPQLQPWAFHRYQQRLPTLLHRTLLVFCRLAQLHIVSPVLKLLPKLLPRPSRHNPNAPLRPRKALLPAQVRISVLNVGRNTDSHPLIAWTTCPYVVRDGKVNPDTDTLRGPDAVQAMSQSVIYNAVAYALQKTSSYSQNVAKAIDAFFLSSSTAMLPNVNYGQLVRGPGKDHQVGTFTGILDLRGMVKVSNAIQVMRTSKAPDWTSAREASMTNWMKSYISWLQTSNLGKSVASKAK